MTHAHASIESDTVHRLSHHDFRRLRHIDRNTRLREQIIDLVRAYRRSEYIGGNAMVETMAQEIGFEPHDLCICDIRINGRLVTLICVPHNVWNRAYAMGRVIDLRFRARKAGYNVVLVPQGFVERQPRSDNASMLRRLAKVRVDATTRMIILAHLIENGDCALAELADLIEHPDPFGAVLHLVAVGAVSIDINQCITPYTMVGLPDPRSSIAN